MSEMQSQELPLVFDCAGEKLVGIIHKPVNPATIGVVTIIAGGPQYRGGVGRGMVSAARELASAGIPVMRFDHRGLGDSSGEFLGFEHISEDIQAAVNALRREVPEITGVVLWGGCDAASAAMIHGWKLTDVISLVLGNPWLTTTKTRAVALRKHYLSRLGERSFWRKLIRFEYNLLDYARSGLSMALSKLGRLTNGKYTRIALDEVARTDDPVDKMLDGLRRFKGPVLFLMSGQSLLSKEFDELVSTDAAWHTVYSRPTCKRIDFAEADHTFSSRESREEVNSAIRGWLLELSKK